MPTYAPQRLTRGLWRPKRARRVGLFSAASDDPTKAGVSRGALLASRRRVLAHLARELTSRKTVSCCGLALLGRDVHVRARRGRPALFCGVTRCKSPWECPDCMVDMQRVRGEKLQRANAKWRSKGAEHVMAMLTLTVPHGLGDDLRVIRRRVATSWRYVQQGAPWKRCLVKFAIDGTARALEVTHGERHGFHPHLHVALYTARTLMDAELAELERWVSERWRKAITNPRHGEPWPAPHPVHGVRCTRLEGSDYLVKMGLDARELVMATTKVGREGNRTPLQVLHALKLALAAGDHERAGYFAQVWRSYTRGMLGARQLTYSRGFLESLGLEDDPPDDQLELAECDGVELVATISAEDFNKIRSRPRLLAALSYVSVHFQPGHWAEAVGRLVDAARGLPPVPF